MDAETAVMFVDRLISQKTGEHLTHEQREIFRGVWDGKKYPQILEDSKIYAYSKNPEQQAKTTASNLWQCLTKIFNEKISQKSLRATVERKYKEFSENQGSESVSLSNNSDHNQDIGGSDPNFVGREDAIAHLNNLIQQGKKVIQIIASGGTGKTVLAQKYLNDHFPKVLEFNIAKERKDIASVESLLEEKLRQLGEEPGREFMVSLDRLKQKLKTEKIGILIDNLEPALDHNGMFINGHRSYVELLKVLTDISVNSITFITSRERLGESLDITLYNLPSLTISAWGEYWQNQKINTDSPIFTEIYKAFGGNALAMKVLCEMIINDFKGDMVAYWQDQKIEDSLMIEKAVENLIKEQFERLKMINLSAYNLLCRLGCYRYQDVPTVSEKGLFCLLWHLTENKQKKEVIKVLKERALVEFNNGDYWLHPVIREEAIERLRNSEDWEKANTQAAEFWTESVKSVETIKDALTAFEAYYHYLNIGDYDQAGYVLTLARNNQWEKKEYIVCSCYRLGLLNQTIINIEKIINKINNNHKQGYTLARLYNNLGDLYWLTGCLSKAIKAHHKSMMIATEFNIKQLKTVSYFNIALCLIDIGNIKPSIIFCKKALDISII